MSFIRNSASTAPPVIILGKTRSASLGGVTIVQAGDTLGQLDWYGADGVDMEFSASIQVVVDGTPASNVVPSYMRFLTTTSGASLTEAMRLTITQDLAITATHKFYLDGLAGTGDTYIAESGANVLILVSGASTSISIASTAVSITTPNTVSGTGLMVTSNAGTIQEIMRDSSSRRWKTDIEDAEIDITAVLSVNARTYNRKGQKGLLGFIAEEFHDAGFSQILDYDKIGPTGFLEYGRGITALHHAVLQAHRDEIAQLKEEVRLLKAA